MNRFPVVLASILAVLSTSPLAASWDAGVDAFNTGRYEDAVSLFRDCVAASPQAPAGHYMLGMSLLRQERLAEAIGALGKAFELGPDDVRYSLALAQAQLKARRPDDALTTLGTADPAAVPDAMRSIFEQLLAKVAVSSRRDSDAERILKRALAVNPKSRPLWQALAIVTQRLDRPEESFSALASAFELDPSDPEAGAGAARSAIAVAQDEDDPDRKVEWYRRAAEVAQRLAGSFPTAEHHMLAGSAEMGAHQYQSALSSFQKARDAGADDVLLHYYLGRSNLALDCSEQALTHLQTSLGQSPDAELTREIHAARGLAYRKLEDFEHAADAYRLAGDAAQAAEMTGYADNRRQWAAEKARCIDKQRQIEQLRADSDELQGTPAWEELEQQFADVLAACETYLQAQPERAGSCKAVPGRS